MVAAVQVMLSTKAVTQIDLNPLWSNVVLALHFDGTNASTVFTDEKAHTLTRIGTPTITTAQSKFGGASGQFSNGGITVGGDVYNADYDFGTGDFTVRCWVRPTSIATDMVIFDQRFTASSASGIVIWVSGGKLAVFTDAATYFNLDTVNLPINTWTHVEVGSASQLLKTFKNGVALTAAASTVGYNFIDGRCFVGQHDSGGGGGFNWVGQLDDLQVVKGQCLHTANFTPPATAWPNS